MKKKENIFGSFGPTSLPEWERVATDELRGANPWNKLGYEEYGLNFKPFYTPENSVPASFPHPVSENNFLGPRTWYNCPLVVVADASRANKTALQHLKQGADGIFFQLLEPIDFESLLRDIEWPHCSLSFLAKDNETASTSDLMKFFQKKYRNNHSTIGAFFGNLKNPRPTQPSFSFIGYPIPSTGSPVEELVSGLLTVTHAMAGNFGTRSDEVAFSIEIGTDFFMEIIKLRALRILWEKILVAKKGKSGTPVFIHARSRPWIEQGYSPHGNMLKSTSASMAAILGGCDALTVEAEDQNDDTMNRVARNVSNILREESHFSKVSDPLTGSHFIESMTRQLIDAAWEKLLPELKS